MNINIGTGENISYMYKWVKLATVVEGDSKAPF